VFVILQKPSGSDFYNITAIIETIEAKYPEDPLIAAKLAVILCIGGNDFIPKYFGINHKKVCNLFFHADESRFREGLFLKENTTLSVQYPMYVEFIKCLYCNQNSKELAFDMVRKQTMLSARKSAAAKPGQLDKLKNSQKWLPPKTALEKVAQLVQLQINYLETAGDESATLPNFQAAECLRHLENGEVEYYFGEDSSLSTSELADLTANIQTPVKQVSKRKAAETPQKGRRKKIVFKASTPKKNPA